METKNKFQAFLQLLKFLPSQFLKDKLISSVKEKFSFFFSYFLFRDERRNMVQKLTVQLKTSSFHPIDISLFVQQFIQEIQCMTCVQGTSTSLFYVSFMCAVCYEDNSSVFCTEHSRGLCLERSLPECHWAGSSPR